MTWQQSTPLIPGLPDDVAELCLLRLPFPHRPLARSVSSSWNKTLKTLKTLNLPFLFTLSSVQIHGQNHLLHFHAFDPRAATWLDLPPPPPPHSGKFPIYPSATAAAAATKGEIFLIGGMRADTGEAFDGVSVYSVVMNSWAVRAPMKRKRAFFAAGLVGGAVIAAGGGEVAEESVAVERYGMESDKWAPAAAMQCGMAR